MPTIKELSEQCAALNDRQNKAVRAHIEQKAEYDGLTAIPSGVDPSTFEDRKTDLRRAKKLLTEAVNAWKTAYTALKASRDAKTAEAALNESLTCTEQVERILGLNTPFFIVLTDDPAPLAEPTPDPVPVPVPSPARKDEAEVEEEPEPAPEADDKFAKVLEAINGVRNTCTDQHNDLTSRLDTLQAGTLQTERAEALRGLRDDQFANLMKLAGLLTPQGLSMLDVFTRLTDDQFNRILASGGLVARVEDLEGWREDGITLGDTKFAKTRRNFVRPDHTDPTTH